MTYKIERDVPIPSGTGRPPIYPFEDLKVGESFVVSPEDAGRVRSAASHASKTYNIKITIRKAEDGYRCWRTA